ncbi:hypothetical protein [Conexibacter sp. SYSU D00693]|uniref:hypothetical protein n=1 Tax=Conexibacter sp. SYSU D00693 TaxID=2812560 RepID=UPI00196B95B5|nr:hypothetical protein [Conexibacter sp. SYSU D00693]
MAETAGVVGKGAIPDLVRAGAAGVALFAVCGFGLTRLLLPDGLRRYEPLWVLPIGACALALGMTVLGYVDVPFNVSLAAVALAGVAVGVVAVRRTGGVPAAATWRRSGWPTYVALLLMAVALIPLFRAGFVTVGGEGQDAHMAVGTAEFLQDHHPTSKAVEEPVDEVWLQWRSKPPIYYALAAHARVAGLDVFQVISTEGALLLAIACLGFFLVARELLRAPLWVALLATGLVGLDRMVLHTVMHPYFNQTWGFMTMPFIIVLAWWAVTQRSRGGLVLLGLVSAVGVFAYPLMLPIPGIALLVWLWPERRRLSPRRMGLTRRSLVWAVPLGLVLVLPLFGVLEKVVSGGNVVVDPTRSLRTWGGDLTTYYEEAWFLGLPSGLALGLLAPVLVYGGWRALRSVPPLLARGVVAVVAFAVVFAIWFRIRDFGFYFHFKVLAFCAPFALLVVAVGLGRIRQRAIALVALLALLALGVSSANHELGQTFDQLPKRTLELRSLANVVPPGDSIRLDVDPQEQNWVAFMLHERPLCSQKPLLGTSYPHVQTSRKADYVLGKRHLPRPRDAIGRPVATLEEWSLWRQDPRTPGRERCSQEMVQPVTVVDL